MADFPLGFDPATARFAQVLASTGEIMGVSVTWPRDDGAAIVNSSGIYLYDWYLNVPADALQESPQFKVIPDSPAYKLTPYDPPAATGAPKGTCQPAYKLVPRSLDEQKIQIRDHSKAVIAALLPSSEEPEHNALALEAACTRASGGVLTAQQISLLADVVSNASLIRVCQEIEADLIARAVAGQAYDIAGDPRWPITAAELEAFSGGVVGI